MLQVPGGLKPIPGKVGKTSSPPPTRNSPGSPNLSYQRPLSNSASSASVYPPSHSQMGLAKSQNQSSAALPRPMPTPPSNGPSKYVYYFRIVKIYSDPFNEGLKSKRAYRAYLQPKTTKAGTLFQVSSPALYNLIRERCKESNLSLVCFNSNLISIPITPSRSILTISIEKDGMVEKSTWESFIIWFSPLDALENMYQTSGGDATSLGGYDINNILSICTPK